MNYKWKEIASKGQIEKGLFLQYTTTPEDGRPETMVVIHCFGSEIGITWCCARFYFKAVQSEITDGFFHWVSDDVRRILEEKSGLAVDDKFIMHAEYYCDIEEFSTEIPFTLGDYSL